jgi:excisionase family DNA binding protein
MQAQANSSNEVDLLSREQAAKRLGISARNLSYLRDAGKLPFIQIGRRILFSPLDLDQFIEARKVNG